MHPSASSNSLKANTRLHKTRTLQANSSSSELHSTCVELVLVLAQRALPSRARSGVLWEYRLFCGVLFCGLSGHPSLGESQVSGRRGQSRRSELRARAIVLEEMDLAITSKKRSCKTTSIESHIKNSHCTFWLGIQFNDIEYNIVFCISPVSRILH